MSQQQTKDRPMSRDARVFIAMFRIAISNYYENLVALFMTMGLPLIFMVMGIFSVRSLSGAEQPRITLGIDPSVSQECRERITGMQIPAVFVVPVTGDSASGIVKSGQARLYLTQEGAPPRVVLYAGALDQPEAALFREVVKSCDAKSGFGTDLASDFMLVRTPARDWTELTFIPAIIVMSLLNLALFTAGTKLLQDRASGALRLYRNFPMRASLMVGAEFITKMSFAILQTVLFCVIGYLLSPLAFSMPGFLLTLVTATVLSIPLFAFAYAIAANLPSQSRGVHVFTIANLGLLFLGGIAFPFAAGTAMYFISALTPTVHYLSIMRIVMLNAPPIYPIWASLAYLVVFTAICVVILRRPFKFSANP